MGKPGRMQHRGYRTRLPGSDLERCGADPLAHGELGRERADRVEPIGPREQRRGRPLTDKERSALEALA